MPLKTLQCTLAHFLQYANVAELCVFLTTFLLPPPLAVPAMFILLFYLLLTIVDLLEPLLLRGPVCTNHAHIGGEKNIFCSFWWKVLRK